MAAGAGRKVVVTGVGALTPLGIGAAPMWAAMLAGRCGVTALAQEWAAGLPVRIAAQVADPAAAQAADRVAAWVADQVAVAAASFGSYPDRAASFLLAALAEAWDDAGFAGPAGAPGSPRPDRTAVAAGTGVGGVAAWLPTGPRHAGSPGPDCDRVQATSPPLGLPTMLLGGAAAWGSAAVGAQAGAHAIGGACAAGADAIAYALALIRSGRADVVAAGGAEAAVHPLAIAAFARMSALSRRNDEPSRACRPYDKNRDGFVLGEGAGVLILESAAHAAARGARPYCELAGSGTGVDAHHVTQPEPTGRGMRLALRAALADAGLDAAQVRHVNPHATGSSQGDVAESRAIAAVLGRRGCCVSATKSMTGHLIGAAGAVEAVATVLALRDRLAPVTINVDDLDEDIEVDVVRHEPRRLPCGPIAALSNSAAFGGHNVALAFRSDQVGGRAGM